VTLTGLGAADNGFTVPAARLVVTVIVASFVPLTLNWTVGVAALVTLTQPGARLTENVTAVLLLAAIVWLAGVTVTPPVNAANVTVVKLAEDEPGVSVTVTGVVPEDVLQVRVGAVGEAVSRLAALSRFGDAVNVSSTGSSFKPDRLNNEKSIMDHPFSSKMLTTDARKRR
jgi:hypothetical protein